MLDLPLRHPGKLDEPAARRHGVERQGNVDLARPRTTGIVDKLPQVIDPCGRPKRRREGLEHSPVPTEEPGPQLIVDGLR